MSYKIDLHTHSTASPDGGISLEQYQKVLSDGLLDYIAITDHNRIDFALSAQKALGKQIIVGEEITTTHGEIIGLFLTEKIQSGLSPLETVQAIKAQSGIVYIPHPFETVRKGISELALNEIAELVDLIEVHNGRAVFQNRGPHAATWSKLHQVARAASSDAHGVKGLGYTYSVVSGSVTKANFLHRLNTARLIANRPPLSSLLYPKLNRLRRKIKH